MGFVVFEEADVGLEVFSEEDPKSVPLIGLIHFSLVNAIDEVGSSEFGLLQSLGG